MAVTNFGEREHRILLSPTPVTHVELKKVFIKSNVKDEGKNISFRRGQRPTQ